MRAIGPDQSYWRTGVLRLLETNQKSQIKIKRLNPLFHIIDQIKDNVVNLALLFHGGPLKITLTVPLIRFFSFPVPVPVCGSSEAMCRFVCRYVHNKLTL